jgi:uncharacterized protein (DUF1499 family)
MERLWMVPTYVILTLLVIGPLGSFLRVFTPLGGFQLVFLAVLVGVVFGIGLAGAAAFASATGKTWRPRALRGSIVPLGLALAVFAMLSLRPTPMMNDVSTDLLDRLEFTPDVAARRTSAEPQTEQRAHFDELQRQHYGDIAPILLSEPVEQAFARAEAVARAMPGWTVTSADPAMGRIEAYDTSRIFHFVDDVVIRVRAEGAGSRVDIRSRSRDGLGDSGVNAERVRAYIAAFQARSAEGQAALSRP